MECVRQETLVDIAGRLTLYEAIKRMSVVEIAEGVGERATPEELYAARMKVLGCARAFVTLERAACDTITAAMTRITGELDEELASIATLERETTRCLRGGAGPDSTSDNDIVAELMQGDPAEPHSGDGQQPAPAEQHPEQPEELLAEHEQQPEDHHEEQPEKQHEEGPVAKQEYLEHQAVPVGELLEEQPAEHDQPDRSEEPPEKEHEEQHEKQPAEQEQQPEDHHEEQPEEEPAAKQEQYEEQADAQLVEHNDARDPGVATQPEGNSIQRGMVALMEWTGKTSAQVVYDSTVDEFTAGGIFEQVSGKPNIALIAFTAECDVFGGFYSVAVDKQDTAFFDPTIFLFSLESHGRCETPKHFTVKEDARDTIAVRFCEPTENGWCVSIDAVVRGGVHLGNAQSTTTCWGLADLFDGIEPTTLTGTDGPSEPFHCTRLVAFHLS